MGKLMVVTTHIPPYELKLDSCAKIMVGLSWAPTGGSWIRSCFAQQHDPMSEIQRLFDFERKQTQFHF
jgi:hypothetical protein